VLVLASASPRRRELLGRYLDFEIRPAGIDESVAEGERPEDYVARLARQKAEAVARSVPIGTVVLAADTTVDVDGSIVGKPVDDADARRILARLSGREHRVHTGVCAGTEVFTVTTTVRFVPLSPAAIDWYVATGEPLDAAGAYAIQGAGGAFVAAIEGSWSNVVGLPLAETLAALARAGLPVPVR
jgi:septum formation protein